MRLVPYKPRRWKPVFGVFDQAQHYPGCTSVENVYRLEHSDSGSKGMVLSIYQDAAHTMFNQTTGPDTNYSARFCSFINAETVKNILHAFSSRA